jgi:hypothetical protein
MLSGITFRLSGWHFDPLDVADAKIEEALEAIGHVYAYTFSDLRTGAGYMRHVLYHANKGSCLVSALSRNCDGDYSIHN